MARVSEFLRTPIAKKIRAAGEVVVYRETMDGKRIANAMQRGSLVESDEGLTLCSLEVGKQVLATGKIVQKKGHWYFQVHEINEIEEVSK